RGLTAYAQTRDSQACCGAWVSLPNIPSTVEILVFSRGLHHSAISYVSLRFNNFAMIYAPLLSFLSAYPLSDYTSPCPRNRNPCSSPATYCPQSERQTTATARPRSVLLGDVIANVQLILISRRRGLPL